MKHNPGIQYNNKELETSDNGILKLFSGKIINRRKVLSLIIDTAI